MTGNNTGISAFKTDSLKTQYTFSAKPLAHSDQDDGRATVQADPQEPPRPDIVKLLGNKDHKWSGIVRDYDECQELTKQYISLNDKAGKTDVEMSNDFPEDKQAQKELARQLFEAILEVDPATSDHMHSQRIRELSNLEVELLSWELLFAIHRAQDGIVGWAKWSPKASQRYEKCGNFRERFELVKEGCRGALSHIPSVPAALYKAETNKEPSVPRAHCTLDPAGKSVAGPHQPVAPLARRMPISGGARVEYPVAQPNPVAWLPPLPAPSLPLPVWGLTEDSMSPHPQGMAVGLETGTGASTVVENPEEFEFLNQWIDFAPDDYGWQPGNW
ncbi:hypothetical protein B0I37DRAFT_426693 [Chaetomium sp. MPI-CAGE-AT-0009]|nr:hypothetical protein B0I37DRAFT_426693 [Chaetomium sp. MPI-CAGE-AT-0009]